VAFAITLTNLEDAMERSGCPICYLGKKVAKHNLESLLWENVNDPATREAINAALGFCPDHTQLLVMLEMSSSGPVLGVNLIFEHLARIARDDLSSAKWQIDPVPFTTASITSLITKKNKARRGCPLEKTAEMPCLQMG